MTKLHPYILFGKYICILAQDVGSPRNQHCLLRALTPDPGARALALSMWPLHTLGAPPAVTTWRRRRITLLSSYNSFCFCRHTVAFLQRGRTPAYLTMGRLIPAIRCTLAINPAFSVAPIDSPRCVDPSLWQSRSSPSTLPTRTKLSDVGLQRAFAVGAATTDITVSTASDETRLSSLTLPATV